MALRVGQTVWLCDENRRVYHTDSGSSSAPIFRGYFVEHKVIGETRTSWLLEHGWKIDKKTGKLRKPSQGFFGMHADVYETASDVDAAVFIHDNRYEISRAVLRISDAAKLRAIQALLDDGMKKE